MTAVDVIDMTTGNMNMAHLAARLIQDTYTIKSIRISHRQTAQINPANVNKIRYQCC